MIMNVIVSLTVRTLHQSVLMDIASVFMQVIQKI